MVLAALAGSGMIMYSTSVAGGLPLYYSGVALIFVAISLNGSFMYSMNRLQEYFKRLLNKVIPCSPAVTQK